MDLPRSKCFAKCFGRCWIASKRERRSFRKCKRYSEIELQRSVGPSTNCGPVPVGWHCIECCCCCCSWWIYSALQQGRSGLCNASNKLQQRFPIQSSVVVGGNSCRWICDSMNSVLILCRIPIGIRYEWEAFVHPPNFDWIAHGSFAEKKNSNSLPFSGFVKR